VEDERIDVGPKLGDDERDALGHQACDESNIATKAVELRDDDRAPELARSVRAGLVAKQRRADLRAASTALLHLLAVFASRE
jgi:hypothetical protein